MVAIRPKEPAIYQTPFHVHHFIPWKQSIDRLCGTKAEAQPLLALGENDEHNQAGERERSRGESGCLEHRGRRFFHIYTGAVRQRSLGKYIAASQNARGAGHLCLLSEGGAWQVEKEAEEEREANREVQWSKEVSGHTRGL